MNIHHLWQRFWLRCALILGFWTLLGLVDAAQMTYAMISAGRALIWWRILATGFLDWYIFAALTPALLWLTQRLPIRGAGWVWRLLLHLGLSLATALFVITVGASLIPFVAALTEEPTFQGSWRFLFFYKLHLYVLLYWLVVGAWHLLALTLEAQERALKASQLEARLAQAQLQVLKMQLHPHFLFNTLNAISALIHQDPDLADRMLARLGELLRLTLASASAQEVPLRHELELINPYLEIQQSRLGSRLAVRLDIDPETMDAHVPNLMLQPLVENAIQRGIAPRPGGGRIEVQARRDGDTLRLIVRDEGQPYPNGHAAAPEGVEVATTRTRLQQMYGTGHRFTVEDGPPGSHVLTLEIPFHKADATALSPASGDS